MGGRLVINIYELTRLAREKNTDCRTFEQEELHQVSKRLDITPVPNQYAERTSPVKAKVRFQ